MPSARDEYNGRHPFVATNLGSQQMLKEVIHLTICTGFHQPPAL